jgi:HlyD family secretion protein
MTMIQETDTMDRIVEKPGLSRRTKITVGAAAALLLSAGILWPSVRRWSQAEESVDLERLRIATVTRGDLQREVSAQGRVVAANHPRLFSPAQGIAALAVKAGESVRKGQVLVRLESPELQSQLAQEMSRLQSLESDVSRSRLSGRQRNVTNAQTTELRRVNLAAARRELERSERLKKEGLLNDVDYERGRDAVRRAEVELEQAEQGGKLEKESLDFEADDRARQIERQRLVIDELQRRVRQLDVVAPFDGLVATVDVQDRDAVQQNAPLLTVVDLSRFEIEVRIPDSYAGEIAPGVQALIEDGGRSYPGTLTAVSPEIKDSQIAGTVQFSGLSPDGMPAGLRQSQRVSVRLVLDRRANVIKVPRGPFLDSSGGRRIYVLDGPEGGLATLREIRTGASSVGEIEIVDGLRAGEQVVLSDIQQFNGAQTVLVRR